MQAFGLTGNMGCGKSTVAGLLAQHEQVLIFDCDSIAKNIILDPSHKKIIIDILDSDVFSKDTAVFKKISHIIFQQPQKKRLFEKFIHPLVLSFLQEKTDSQTVATICVVESAVIYETNWQDNFLEIILVTCSQTEQFRRLTQDRGLDEDEIKARLKHQFTPPSTNQPRFTIYTDCTFAELKKRVDKLYTQLKLRQE